MKKIIIFVLLIVSVLAVFLLTTNNSSVVSERPIKVAVSIKPIADLVKVVGGDKVETITMLPEGSSPHTFEPMAADLAKLTNTKLAFMIGQELDDWAITMLTSGAAEGYVVHDLSEDISLLTSTEADEPGNNPHYWLSYSNAEIIVTRIATELAAFDEVNKDYYQDNANSYIAKLETARTSALEQISVLTKKEIVTFHAAFQYFAKDLGLEVVASIEPFPGSEPSPQYLAEVGAIIEQYQVTTLFREPQLSDAVVSAIANDYGASIDTLNPMGEGDDDFIAMMQYNVDTIVKALSK